MCPILILDDQHDVIDAIRGAVDVYGGDQLVETVGSVIHRGDDEIVHMVLDKGIAAGAADHGVKPATAIEMIVACVAFQVVVAVERQTCAIQEGLCAGICG